MSKNRVVKTYQQDDTFVAPAGVTSIVLRGIRAGFQKLAAGGQTSLAVDVSGNAYAWGNSVFGRLGNNTATDVSSPVLVVGGKNFLQVGIASAAYGLEASGDMYAWGRNQFSEIGDNTNGLGQNRSSPTLVVGSRKYKQPCGGNASAIALQTSGLAVSWGNNGSGRLGTNDATDRSSPVAVSGGRLFKQLSISSSGVTASAVDNSGNGYAWGSNTTGQVGDNSIVDRSSPVAIVGGLKFKAISSAAGHSIGLTTAGDMYAWGDNSQGQLGQNNLTNRSSPVLVLGGRKYVAMEARDLTNVALTVDGDIYAWGANGSGQLGDNSISDRSSPTLVVGGFKFSQLATAGDHVIATRQDGIMMSWGLNSNGQLGNLSTTNRSSPVLVTVGTQLWNSQTETTLNEISLPVTPGTSYSIQVFSDMLAFANGVSARSYGITRLEVEYGA